MVKPCAFSPPHSLLSLELLSCWCGKLHGYQVLCDSHFRTDAVKGFLEGVSERNISLLVNGKALSVCMSILTSPNPPSVGLSMMVVVIVNTVLFFILMK